MELSARLNVNELRDKYLPRIDVHRAGSVAVCVAAAATRYVASADTRWACLPASHAQAGRVWLKVLSPVVALTTETVIWLGMHL